MSALIMPAVMMVAAAVVAAATIAHGINHAAGKHCRDGDGNNQFDRFHGAASGLNVEIHTANNGRRARLTTPAA